MLAQENISEERCGDREKRTVCADLLGRKRIIATMRSMDSDCP